MRCLYCGKQLALFRRLTGSGEFCSDAHKQSYHEEYNRLALTRLIAAQTKSEEPKAPLPTLTTLEMARGGTRALPEARQPKLHQRWGDLSSTAPKSRMLEAPATEPPPPPAPSFIIVKVPAGRPPEDSVAAALIELIPPGSFLAKPVWNPAPALSVPEEELPALADILALDLLPQVVDWTAPSAEPNTTTLVAAEFASTLDRTIGLAFRAIRGLQARPPATLDFTKFAVAPSSLFEPETQFEEYRYAVLVFGAPDLEPLRRDTLVPADSELPQPGTPAPAKRPFRVEPQRSASAGDTRNRRADRNSGAAARSVQTPKPNIAAVAVALSEPDSIQQPVLPAEHLPSLQVVPPPAQESVVSAPIEVSKPEAPLAAPAVSPESQEERSAEPRPAPKVPTMEARRPSSIKVKLAALAANESLSGPDAVKTEDSPATKPLFQGGTNGPSVPTLSSLATALEKDQKEHHDGAKSQSSEESEKPKPRLPTIPAAKRRSNSAMPSILQADAEPADERNQSLWGAIRKYIKR